VIPLLPMGLHEMDLDELRRLCVDGFPTSTNRRYLADAFEELVDALVECGLSCEIWVNGSFLTSKLDPADLDVVFIFDARAVSEAGRTLRPNYTASGRIFGMKPAAILIWSSLFPPRTRSTKRGFGACSIGSACSAMIGAGNPRELRRSE
jgi:hypothetical protein